MSRKFTVTSDTKSSSWIISFSYRDETGQIRRYRKSAGKGATRKEAEKQAAELVRLHDRDKRLFVDEFATKKPKVEPVAFSGLADRWYREHVLVKLRQTTRRTHEQIIRVHLVTYFGDRDARGITRADVSTYVAAKVRDDLSPKSVNNHLSVLRSLFDFACDTLALLTVNPLAGVEPLKVGDQGFDYLNAGDGERYLTAAARRDPEFYPLLATALRAGLRQGELCAMRWSDVKFDRDELIVARSCFREQEGPTKGNRVRRVPMSPDLRAVLAAHRPADARPADLVFPHRDGGHLNGDMIKHPHRRASVAIDRPALRFHDLRHSFASQLVQGGAPLNAVQQLLGHADLKITLRYAHLAPDNLAGWVAALDGKRPALALRALDSDAECEAAK